MTTEQPDTTLNPAPPLATRRPLRRSPDRVIGGVAAGLGDYLNVDPILIRAIFAGLMVFGGSGLALYVLGWLLIPAADRRESIAEGWIRGVGQRIGSAGGLAIVILVILFIFVTSPEGVDLQTGARWIYIPPIAFVAAAVAVIGVLLLRSRDGGRTADTAMADMPARVAGPPDAATATAPAPAWVPAPAWAPAAPLRRPRESSPLGWYVLAAAFVAVGLIGLLDTATDLRVEPGQYFGVGLLALGLGLVVGAWWGRARLLILLGILVLPIAGTAAFLSVPLEGGFGDFEYRPANAGEILPAYRLSGGELRLDLTDIDAGGPPVRIEASVGIGEIVVIVPRGADVDVSGSVEGGRLSILGREHAGTGLSDRVADDGLGVGPVIALHLETGIGSVRVERAYQEGN